jgi:hypothetical protein
LFGQFINVAKQQILYQLKLDLTTGEIDNIILKKEVMNRGKVSEFQIDEHIVTKFWRRWASTTAWPPISLSKYI